MSLSNQQERAAKFLALGLPIGRVATLVGVSRQTIHAWQGHKEFQAARERCAVENQLLLEELLLEAERQAAVALIDMMNAKKTVMRDGVPVEVPDWDVIAKAAFRALDSAGKRGKPVEKTETKNLALSGDLNELVQNALRDPGVRQLLGPGLPYGQVEAEAVVSPPQDFEVEILPVPPVSDA